MGLFTKSATADYDRACMLEEAFIFRGETRDPEGNGSIPHRTIIQRLRKFYESRGIRAVILVKTQPSSVQIGTHSTHYIYAYA